MNEGEEGLASQPVCAVIQWQPLVLQGNLCLCWSLAYLRVQHSILRLQLFFYSNSSSSLVSLSFLAAARPRGRKHSGPAAQ
jgi:hypothetical protein